LVASLGAPAGAAAHDAVLTAATKVRKLETVTREVFMNPPK
jgi:hypothetical protein